MAETSKIVQYIREQISAGYPENMIRDALMKQGWSHDEVDEAMSLAGHHAPKPPAPEHVKAPPGHAGPHPHEPHPGAHQPQKPDKHAGRIGPGFLLSLAGGAMIILNSVLDFSGVGDMLSLVVPGVKVSFLGMLDVTLSAFDSFFLNSIIGGFLIAASLIIYMMPDKARLTGMFMVALSLITVLIGNGFLIGGIVAILGGILAVAGR